ncbi:MAG: hypothetical protein LAO08_18900 [Acidobacteriia bacterium]|nr:hypothetical protein [Terriglobia bacterium]
MRRSRPALFFLFAGILTVLVFLGAQFQAPVAFALPSFTSSSVSSPATNTCAGCHSGSALSGGGATITFPSGTTYTPGVAQTLTVKVTDPTHAIFSFILTARLASNVSTQAGTFTAGSGSTVAGMDIEASSFTSSTWTFTWTPPATNAGNVTFFLTGLTAGSPGTTTSGNGIYQSQFTLTSASVAPTPDFSLSASPSSLTIAQGASGTSTITTTPQNGFAGSVALAVSGLPSGVSASFTGSTLTLSASSSAAPGTSTVTITGTSGSLTHTTTVSLTVAAAAAPNFSLSASPSSLTIAQGASGTSAISTTPQNGFAGSVALAASGLPSGVSASFTASTLTLSASSAAAAGTSTVTITGTSGSLTHTTTVSLTVTAAAAPNFSLSASPSSLTISPGSSRTSTITITPSGGFSPATVSFAPPGLPSGVTASFSPVSGAGTSTLTLSASSSAASLTVGLTITGASGSLTHTTTVSLTVSPATGASALTVTPSLLTFNSQAGGAIPPSQNLTLAFSNGSIAFTASTSGGAWLSESPASGTAPGIITVSVNPANLSAGRYSGMIHITATGGSATNIPVTLNVSGQRVCDDDCAGAGTTLHAAPFVIDPTFSRTLAAVWVNWLGIPTGTSTNAGDPGLVLSKDAAAPSGTQAGAIIRNVDASLTELGYDYRMGGQCTATSPRFVVVTTLGATHTVGGCTKGTTTAAPVMGWNRVRFNLTDPSIQSSPSLVPGDVVSTITLIMDVPASADPASAGGLVVIGNIDVNGTLVGK